MEMKMLVAPEGKTASNPIDVLARAVVASQRILADYLEQGGISREQAINLLPGILDHEDVVQAVRWLPLAEANCSHCSPALLGLAGAWFARPRHTKLAA